MTIKGETVLSGAPHPGTTLTIMKSGAGWYLGFLDTDGFPYSRESAYFNNKELADLVLQHLRTGEEIA
jgi:hypothetical protein